MEREHWEEIRELEQRHGRARGEATRVRDAAKARTRLSDDARITVDTDLDPGRHRRLLTQLRQQYAQAPMQRRGGGQIDCGRRERERTHGRRRLRGQRNTSSGRKELHVGHFDFHLGAQAANEPNHAPKEDEGGRYALELPTLATRSAVLPRLGDPLVEESLRVLLRLGARARISQEEAPKLHVLRRVLVHAVVDHAKHLERLAQPADVELVRGKGERRVPDTLCLGQAHRHAKVEKYRVRTPSLHLHE